MRSIQALLSNPSVNEEIANYCPSSDGVLRDACDGSFFKKHRVFLTHSDALQIVLYYDDIEVANPFGEKAGKHKLGKH